MIRMMLMASAVALAAPALAQTAPDAMANQPGAMNPGQPGSAATDMMTHDQHDVATPANASPTQTTPDDVDGDTMDNQTSAEGTMAVDTSATMTTGTAVNAGVGGPLEAADYPVCTRAVTDNCLQTPRSPRPRG